MSSDTRSNVLQISRRRLLAASAVPLAIRWAYGSEHADAGLVAADVAARNEHTAAIQVAEITMATPDTICVQINDPPIIPGHFQALRIPDPGHYLDPPTFSWLRRPNPSLGGKMDYCAVVGMDKKYLRFQDVRAEQYFNRSAALIAAEYGKIGSLKVIDVYLRSEPYDFGEGRWNTNQITNKTTSSKHFLFLKLSGSLTEGGPYTISFPVDTGLGSHAFLFNDKLTRAIGIRATQHGHRRSDVSKLAYLALWVPFAPREGAIDFVSNYGLTSFEIIDESGEEHFRGKIVQRVGPTTVESGRGFSRASARYASTTNARAAISMITRSNPAHVTYDRSAIDLRDGDVIYIRGTSRNGVDGMPQVDTNYGGSAYTIANHSNAEFDLQGVNSSSFGKFPGYGFIFKTYLANRAGTHVFALDYSAWRANRTGIYRIRVPGLGVSDPFRIDDAVWAKSAQVSAKGEYHQRAGLALDGRFGWSRPVNFKSGVAPTAGVAAPTIFKSTLPYCVTNYAGILSNRGDRIPVNRAISAPWLTRTEEAFWGGWHDAGDWDIRLLGTFGSIYMLLDLVDRLAAARNVKFGIPKSSECLDVSTYGEADELPDLVHQAIWGLDPFRRTQLPGGEVIGGITYNKVGQGDTADQGGYAFEPSWLFRGQAVSYAPDHLVTFAFAGCAAKLAKVLGLLGFPKVAAVWQSSAVKAWSRAEAIFAEPITRDAFYGVLRAHTNWSEVQYGNAMKDLLGENTGKNYRRFAAGCLFALTGLAHPYGNVIVTDWTARPFQLDTAGRACGAWEYAQSTRANSQVAGAIRRAIVSNANNYTDYSEGTVAYRTIHHKNLDMSFGKDCGSVGLGSFLLAAAHQITRQSKYIAAMQAGLCFLQGANQKGLCLTKGLGHRNAKAYLHIDSHCMGTPAPDGLTCYGYSEQNFVSALNFQMGNIVYIQEPINNEASDFESKRVMSPSIRRCFPIYDSIFENALVIEHMEYTTQETILSSIFASMYLHCWDGNG